MAVYSLPGLQTRGAGTGGSSASIYFNSNQITAPFAIPFVFNLPTNVTSTTPVGMAYLPVQVFEVDTISHPGNNIYDVFFLGKSAYGRSNATSNVQPLINQAGQLYPTNSGPSRPIRSSEDSSPFKTVPAFGYTQGSAEYGQPVAETGQIYPQFIPSCDKVRDRILPAESNVTESLQTYADLIYVLGIKALPATFVLQFNSASIKVGRKLAAQKGPFQILGIDLYYIDPNDPFILANALIESTIGNPVQLKRTMILNAESLIQTSTGQASVLEDSIYFRDWSTQTYKWDRDFSVDWWAD
jgi:hypothetical protein